MAKPSLRPLPWRGLLAGFRSIGVGLGALAAATSCGAGGSRGDVVEVEPTAVVVPPGRAASSSAGDDGPVGPAVADETEGTGQAPIFGAEELPEPSAPGPRPLRRRGLLQRVVECEEGTTSLSGTVYIPSGALPVYGATVYVPETELAPLPEGASCSCDVSGEPITTAVTDAAGRFVLEGVPAGDDVPVVVQVGDWRREFNVGRVEACTETLVPDQTLRLPSRRSEGDLPRIAVATGALDALECLVKKLGIDPSEITTPDAGGRVNFFAGYGGTAGFGSEWGGGYPFPLAEDLWSDVESLSRYDVVLLSCEGRREYVRNKSEQARQALFDYANRGGRVFASHYANVWFQAGPEPFPQLAEFVNEDDLGNIPATVSTSFPKGEAMSEWLINTGASESGTEVAIEGAQHTVAGENPEYSQRWIFTEDPPSVQYLSANTPLGAPDDQLCGRVVLSDIHVAGDAAGQDISAGFLDYPDGCVTTELSPQEKVLAFMLFDITSCVIPDTEAPEPPPTIR